MSPVWKESPAADGGTVHELEGREVAASVEVDASRGVTIVVVASIIPGSGAASIDRGKERAEKLIAEALR